MKFVLTILLMIRLSSPLCGNGCLKCSKNDDCLVCDADRDFVLKSHTCEKIATSQCYLRSPTSQCLICKENYYLDQNTGQCVVLEESTAISNCKLYNSLKACSLCQSGFFLKENVCVAVTHPINHCKDYKTKRTCLACETGYTLSLDHRNCVPAPLSQNCSSFTYFECDECEEDYIKDENTLLYKYRTLDTPDKVHELLLWMKDVSLNKHPLHRQEVCSKKKIPYCLVYKTAAECEECRAGYFKTRDGGCNEFPRSKIENCEIYSSFEECEKCVQGFYLENKSHCQLVEPIEKCLIYDPRATVSFCLRCDSGFFVQNSRCVERLNQIEHCAEYYDNHDKCASCSKGWQITADFFHCAPSIKNCKTYHPNSDRNTATLICIECDDEFYYDEAEGSCVFGNINNCKKLVNGGSPVCSLCYPGYFLNQAKLCEEHTEIADCKEYSAFSEGVCNECKANAFPFLKTTECKKVLKLINECVTYKDEFNCERCSKGWYIDNGICILIPTELNCEEYDGSACLSCLPNFYFNNGVCKPIPSHLSENCFINTTDQADQNLSSLGDYQCSVCQPGSYPYTVINNYICTSNEFLVNPIPNCLAYENESCVECDSEYYLYKNTCVLDCPGVVIRVQFEYFENDTRIRFKSRNVCIDEEKETEGCAVMGFKVQDFKKEEYVCIDCKAGYFKVLSKYQDAPEFGYNNPINPVSFGLEVFDILPKVKCIKKENAKMISDYTWKSANMCEYYMVNEGQLENEPTEGENVPTGCVKCKEGFSGKVKGNHPLVVLDSCSPIQHCVYGAGSDAANINRNINRSTRRFISCFICDTDSAHRERLNTFSAFFGLDQMDSITLAPFLHFPQLSEEEDKENGSVNRCMEYNKAPFIRTNELTKLTEKVPLAINCVLIGINLSVREEDHEWVYPKRKIDGGDHNKMRYFCLKCGNGFKPVYYDVGSPIIVECTLFLECTEGYITCEQCESGKAFEYNEKKGVDVWSCVSSGDDHKCFASHPESNQGGKCVYCDNDYVLSKDGVCESVSSNNCLQSHFSIDNGASAYDTYTYVRTTKHGSGCRNCKDGFFPQRISTPKTYCFKNNRVDTIEHHTEAYTAGCKNYQAINGEVSCLECKDGYFKTNQNRCVSVSDFLNCTGTTDGVKCDSCSNGYVNFNGVCHLGKIKDCLVYLDTLNINEQFCLRCAEGKYPIKGACHKGTVPGCKNYSEDESGRCRECDKDHYLVNNGNTVYCYSTSTVRNCEILSDSFAKGVLECEKCEPGYYLYVLKEKEKHQMCIEFNEIPYCVKYEKKKDEEGFSFSCKECETDYYTDGLSCVKRGEIVSNCLTHFSDKDACKLCESGTFLSKDGRCHLFPSGIRNCIAFSDLDTCSLCRENHFLKDNTCIHIDLEERLENCVYYYSKTQCKECVDGYIVMLNQCVKINAKDCLTVLDPDTCETCPNGYGLQTENDITSCVKNQLERCLLVSKRSPFECLECESKYYPNELGKCQEVKEIIGNCLVYASETVCLRCKKGLVLSKDGRLCKLGYFDLLDYNCESYRRLDKPKCSRCANGYLLKNGICQPCSEKQENKGCFVCDPINPETCLICQSHYYMNSEGECLAEKLTNDTDTETSAIGRIMAIPTFLLLFHFL